jgi:uncharacterized membrane protein YkoI
MMMKMKLFPLLITLTALLSMPLSAESRHKSERERDHHYDNRHERRSEHRSDHRFENRFSNHFISREQAADIAQREHPGRVLGVKRKSKTYRVKTLNRRGELRETRINARNGKVVRRH